MRAAKALVFFTFLTSLGLLGGGSARGQTEEPVARARALYESGAKHYYLGEFAAALSDFKEAYRAKDDPALLFNIGQCQYKLGDATGALHSFRGYLHLAKNPPNRAEAEARVAELQPRGPTTVGAGQASAHGPDAPGPELAPGATMISSAAPPVETAAAASERRRRLLAYSVGGAGLVALGVGGIFGIRAFSEWHDSNAHCPENRCDDVGATSAQQAQTSARVADVTIGAGLVLAGVAAYLLLAPHGDPDAPAAVARGPRVTPSIGPHEARLALGLDW